VKIAEVVYGNLFKSLRNIIQSLESKCQIYWISFDSWKEFQQDHRYFMVDENFRDELDDFSKKLDSYSQAAVNMGSEVRKIVVEETQRVFGIEVTEIPRPEVTFLRGYSHSSMMPDLVQCLVSETDPIDYTKRTHSEASGLELTLTITSIDNKISKISYSPEFEGFWESCLRRMKENVTYKFVTEENHKILKEAKKVREEVIKRIEKPWKI